MTCAVFISIMGDAIDWVRYITASTDKQSVTIAGTASFQPSNRK
ncbi:hypothetical protein JCM19237_6134 [Photobacterium aphoticum]|uniref:Uncharacterized protein n=1 Tax=Photobacterium aphoticum TaxID=754436 RepID=A0A090QJZ4_9GAMM|nr:hypothetical protein JCM19237_6134 [Photobacterium aphoticum]